MYSNPLFDEEINPMKIDQHPFNAESDLIESMPNHDSLIIISSKIDSLFDKFAESFSASPIPVEDSDSFMEEIDLSFNLDDPMPPTIDQKEYPLPSLPFNSYFLDPLYRLILMSTFVLCVGCGEPLYGFSPCRWCTCERCGIDMLNGICPLCNSNNSCAYDHNPNSFDCPPDSYHPSHPTYETYSGDTYGNDSHFGYDCLPWFSLNYKPELGCIQNYNSYLHDSLSLPQPYPCCEDCEVTHEPYQCQPMNHDYYHKQNSCYDSTSIGFDQFQPQQYTVNHPVFNAHNEYLDSQKNLTMTLTTVMEQMTSLTSMCKLACQIVQKKLEEKQLEEEQAAKAQSWKLPVCYNDDDDEESSNSLEDNIISELPPCVAITPNEPVDSLSMGDEHFNTISAKESDEFIKSCVENLRLLYDNSSPRPSEEIVFDNSNADIESFSASPIPIEDSDSFIEEIDLSFNLDDPMPPSIEYDDDDSKRDILILK
nr:pre-mRNA splicing Prp18-interacting factor [Tanacetum cinerariifolium]